MIRPYLTRIFAVAAITFAGAISPVPGYAQAVISEFLAENDTGLRDADGDQSDWIELHNPTGETVNLLGWRLTDDSLSPAKWQFPAVDLAPNARLVVFASGKDRRAPGGELHTNFRLSNGGGYVALSRPDGTVARAFANYPPQRADISYGDGLLVDTEAFVTANSGSRYFIPTNNALATTWTAPGFNDASWSAGSSRLGYQTGEARPGLPQAYWTFDDTVSNSIATAPNATLIGATYAAQVPGAIGEGKSLQFVSSGSQYVSAPLDVSETSYTASFWFRTTTPKTGLFTAVDGELGQGGHDRHLFLSGGNIFARVWDTEIIGSTGKNYSDGQWHHVAHVVGSAVAGQRIYVDGVLVASGTKASSNFTWQKRIHFGYSNDGAPNQFFDGQLDDLAIWAEALNAASVSALASGTIPTTLAGFQPHIQTNVEASLRNVGSSLYVRLPFAVNRVTPINRLTLRVRYDDGFIAYLDGVEVARRNAPAGVTAASLALTDRAADEATLVEEIDLSAHVDLLTNGNHVLAIHALNESTNSADFLINAELIGKSETPQLSLFMDPPTAGAENSSGFLGFVSDTVFSPKRGFFETAQNVTVFCATPGATIAYTLDGTDPSPTNGTQVSPGGSTSSPSVTLPVSATSAIRAMAYKANSGMRATNVDSHTYIFLNQVLQQPNAPPGYPTAWAGRAADYGMDANVVNTALPGYRVRDALLALPTLSLTGTVNDFFGAPSGIYYDPQQRGFAAERKVSLEWIYPDGTPGWHVQCGTRMHGNSSRSHSFTPKHPLRLLFRGQYGSPRLREDLFGGGVSKFDELLLRACSTDSMPVVDGGNSDGEQRWNNDKATYLRDQWMRDTLQVLGHPNARGRYCHLYINGLYWGVYNLSERPTAAFFADTFGGEEGEWDVLKDFAEIAHGNATAWNAMMAVNNDSSLTYEARAQKLLGRNPDGTPNPNFPIYLHLESFIDYMIVHIAAGAEDWPDHNYWVGRRRGPLSEGFRFVAWDQEISNESLTRASGRGSGNPFESVGNPAFQSPPDRNGPAGLYDTLRRAPTFQKLFRDRVHELLFNRGPISPEGSRARWLLRQAEIDKAIVAESARWGDGAGEGIKKRETTWLTNMSYMNTAGTGYWDAIFPTQVQRFRNVELYPSIDQPSFSKDGGTVGAGYELFLTTNQPTAYYTLDGSDPMGPDGQPAPTAAIYNGGIVTTTVIPKGSTWRYYAAASAPPSTWKNVTFNDATWSSGPGQLGYGDGDESTTVSFGGNTSNRYLTTYFRKSFTLQSIPSNLTLQLLRDDGAVVYLNGKEVARSNMHPTNAISYSTLASSNVSGADESTFYYTYNLSPADIVVGTNVLAIEVHKVSASEDDLSFDAALEFTGSANATPIILQESATVTARARSATGEWSGKNSAYFTVGSLAADATNLVISELHYHPAPPTRAEELALSSDPDDFEFIELMNIADSPVDLTGVRFSAGVQYTFATGFTLPARTRCAIARNTNAFAARYHSTPPALGAFISGGLSNAGETITLERVDSQGGVTVIRSFAYGTSGAWPTAANGTGPSLVLKAPLSNPNHADPNNWVASADPGGTPSDSPEWMTFSAWSERHGVTSPPLQDEDRDGLPTLLEYAFATDPKKASPRQPEPGVVMHNNLPHLAISFRYRPALDLDVSAEQSVDLSGWTNGPTKVSSVDHGDGSVTEIWRASAAIGTVGAPKYIRVRVAGAF
jgi:hypothetical protein